MAWTKQKIEWKPLDISKLPANLKTAVSEAVTAMKQADAKVKAAKELIAPKLPKAPAGKAVRIALTLGWNGEPKLSVGLADQNTNGAANVEASGLDGFTFA
jgi:hypothetical protein